SLISRARSMAHVTPSHMTPVTPDAQSWSVCGSGPHPGGVSLFRGERTARRRPANCVGVSTLCVGSPPPEARNETDFPEDRSEPYKPRFPDQFWSGRLLPGL